MNANQFVVVEHYSYDMIGTWHYTGASDLLKHDSSIMRMEFFLRGVISPLKYRKYLFPDFQFNAKEYATR